MNSESVSKSHTLLTVVHYFGVVVWSVLFFFGFNFWTSNYLVSIPVALVLAGLMILFVKLICRYKSNPSNDGIWTERIFLLLFVLISSISMVFIYHVVTIAATEKSSITSYAGKEKAIVDHYFADANTDGSYLYFIKKRFEHKQMTNPNEDQALFEDELKGGAIYGDELHSIAYPKFNEYCNHITSWNWFTVSDYLPKMEETKRQIETKLIEISNKPQLVGSVTYQEFISPASASHSDKLRSISHADGDYLLSLLLVIVLMGMILGVYFDSEARIRRRDDGKVIEL